MGVGVTILKAGSFVNPGLNGCKQCASPLGGLVMLVTGVQGNGAPLIPYLPSNQVRLAV